MLLRKSRADPEVSGSARIPLEDMRRDSRSTDDIRRAVAADGRHLE